MTPQEALKQVLEAITQYLAESPDPSEEAVEGLCDAASAARKALAQPEQEYHAVNAVHKGQQCYVKARPEQEPIGEAHLMQEGFTHCIWSEAVVPVGTKFYTTPPPQPKEQEPVAWMHVQGNYKEPSFRQLTDDEVERGWQQYPLYITPPQRKPLRLDELEALWNSQADHMNQWDELGLDEIVAFAQAAHSIKENT